MWQKRINVVVIISVCVVVLTVGLSRVLQFREDARRSHSRNNLKQIGLALYNYESTFNCFPAGGVFNADGRAYHGWMTSILPYIDASPFYNFVNFNEPWDSPYNAGLLLNTRPAFENVSEPSVHRHWEFPVAHYSANAHVFAANSFAKRSDIDQNDQMFLVGELDGDFVPWGCPYNWRELHSINSKPPTYGRSTKDGCQFLFADGHVGFVTNDVSNEILKLMSGDDLVGFEENKRIVQRPKAFLCPDDALFVRWFMQNDDLIVTRTDKARNEKSRENRGPK